MSEEIYDGYYSQTGTGKNICLPTTIKTLQICSRFTP
jgi:hypothetical protein